MTINTILISGENISLKKSEEICSVFEKSSLQKKRLKSIPQITLEIYIDKDPDLLFFRQNKKKILNSVQEFYKEIVTINLEEKELRYNIDETHLRPAERIALAIVPNYKYVRLAYTNYTKGIQINNRDKELLINSLSYLVDNIAIVHKSMIFMNYNKRLATADIGLISYIMSHEIGHCLGLYHTDEFLDDPLRDAVYTPEQIIPHLMRGDYKRKSTKENPIGASLDNASINLIHDFLSKGEIYQIYSKNGFMIHKVIDSLKNDNFYKINEQ